MNLKNIARMLLAGLVFFSILSQAEEPAAPELTLISNVNIFDGKNEKLLNNMHVLVKDNLIETVSDEPLAIIQTDNVTIIDGGGRTLMPGLIEGHGHVMFASDLNKFMNQDEFEQGVNAARRANDYIIVNGDPTKDIRLLMDAEKNTDLIMKDGKIYTNTINTESRK